MEKVFEFVAPSIPLHIFSRITDSAVFTSLCKLWTWFFLGSFLLFIGLVILCCWPVKAKTVQGRSLKPVSSEEIFDRVLELEIRGRNYGSDIQYSARA